MAWREAAENISANVRFHARTPGSRAARLAYVALYFAIYTLFRKGDRHSRALDWLRRSGLSAWPVFVRSEGLALAMDLHTAFDPLYEIHGRKGYEQRAEFAPRPGQTILDVGANVGVFACYAARRGARVIAFEPFPDNFRVLKGNAQRNALASLECVQAALGEAETTARLYVHERAVNHSLVRPSERWVDVPVTTVDAAVAARGLARVDLLKIDTEGTVPQILRGAAETVRRFRPRIVFETDAPEEMTGAAELLSSWGYASERLTAYTYCWPK